MPLDAHQLADLIASVDAMVLAEGCDHTRRFAEAWATDHEVPWDRLTEGLDEFDGYCDCEIVMNCDPADVFG